MQIINSHAANISHILTTGHATNSSLALLAVLTQDEVGQYAVYLGAVDLLCVTDEELRPVLNEQVAAKGEKLGYARALQYFPNIKRDEYRD